MQKNKEAVLPHGGRGRPVAVVLAAGLSSRMNALKQTLLIDDEPAIAKLVRSIKEAELPDVVVVTGHEREAVFNAVRPFGAVEAFNADYKKGMFGSIITGIASAEKVTKRQAPILLFPVDCPLIPASAIMEVLKAHDNEPERYIVPCYQGKKGHPLLIPPNHVAEILAHDGTNGLKGVTRRYETEFIRVETGNEGVVLDMDTPEGYEEILDYSKRMGSNANGHDYENDHVAAGFRGRIFFIRHGAIRQHDDKIFLGQTDVPLSEDGRKEADMAGKSLASLLPNISHVYSSDLIRAVETAEIVVEKLYAEAASEAVDHVDIICVPEFREVNLGDWDGRLIKEVRQEFPEEYEKRGQNILTYKRGNDGENYFDLYYRVKKKLKTILKEEQAGDVVIISHSGTIKAALAAIWKLAPEDAWKQKIDRGVVIQVDFKEE